jgi:3-oxoacyl-[acyl-carrier protein] reductase
MTAAIFNDSGLAGKVAIVTGGARGIGRAIVELLAAEGADVTLVYNQSAEVARQLVAEARTAGLKISSEHADVRDAAGCVRAVEAVAERCGQIDLLVNNAGAIADNLLGMLEDAEIRDVIETNVLGVFNVTRAVVPHMISRRSGKIVNLSSVAGTKGGRGQSNYAASKGAIDAFTRALAVELAPRRITVNAVAPGVIETEMSKQIRERADNEVQSRILLRRYGAAAEIAYAVAFLASKYADYITGQILYVDGGFKME